MKTDATDDVIARKNTDVVCLTQQSNKSPPKHGSADWNKVLQCVIVHDEYVVKDIFLKLGQNPTDIGCVHIRTRAKSLHFMI